MKAGCPAVCPSVAFLLFKQLLAALLRFPSTFVLHSFGNLHGFPRRNHFLPPLRVAFAVLPIFCLCGVGFTVNLVLIFLHPT